MPARQAHVRATAVSRILDHLKDDGGLQGKDIANIVSVSPATVSRWLSGKATPDLRTQTVIAELRQRGVQRFPDDLRLYGEAFSTQTVEVASKAVEIYGGYGFVRDYPMEKFYRDAKIGSIYEGTSNMQLATIGKLILQ